MKKVTIFMFLFIFMASFSLAATYYVSDLFGDDTNDGLSDATPFATIQKAADVMVAGDKVIIDFGEYYESVVPKNNGTPGMSIIYEAKEDVTIIGDEDPVMPVFTLHAGNVYVMDNVFRTVQKFSEDGTPLTKKDSLSALDTEAGIFHDRTANKLYVRSSDDADPATHSDTLFFEPFAFDIVEGSYITIDGFNIKNSIKAIVVENLVSLPGLVIKNNEFEASVGGIIAIDIDGGAADSVHTYESFLINKNIIINDPEYFSRGIRIRNAGLNSEISDNTFIGGAVPTDAGGAALRIEGSNDYPGSQCRGLVIERNFFNEYDTRCIYLSSGDIIGVTIQNNIFFKNKYDKPSIQINANCKNLDYINNTHLRLTSHAIYFQAVYGNTARFYNNIVAWGGGRAAIGSGWNLFFNNRQDSAGTLVEVDYNYWVTDTSMTSSRDDQLIRARIPNSTNLRGGPHDVYGHPMILRPDSLITPLGDTLYFEPTRVTLNFDTIAVDSIPDMWFQPAYPLFADTAAGTPEGFILVEGNKAIDAGFADLAPADDFFGNLRDSKPDIGAIEYGATGIDDSGDLFPVDYTLSNNYPNPFNPETTIEYKLPKAGRIKLSIYNIMGQKVAILYDGIQKFGSYKVKWNGLDDSGRAVPSGLYICHLEAGSYSKTTKMMLLK